MVYSILETVPFLERLDSELPTKNQESPGPLFVPRLGTVNSRTILGGYKDFWPSKMGTFQAPYKNFDPPRKSLCVPPPFQIFRNLDFLLDLLIFVIPL